MSTYTGPAEFVLLSAQTDGTGSPPPDPTKTQHWKSHTGKLRRSYRSSTCRLSDYYCLDAFAWGRYADLGAAVRREGCARMSDERRKGLKVARARALRLAEAE